MRAGLRACTPTVQQPETADAFDSLLSHLEAEIALLQPVRVLTVGASMGGYAAVRAGLAVGAAGILAFGPQIFVHPTHRAALALPYMFFDDPLAELQAEAREAGVPTESAFACWHRRCSLLTPPTQPVIQPVIEVHVGEDAPSDVLEATLLREAMAMASERFLECTAQGLGQRGRRQPTVSVRVHAGLGHSLAKDLRDAGHLAALLRLLISSGEEMRD